MVSLVSCTPYGRFVSCNAEREAALGELKVIKADLLNKTKTMETLNNDLMIEREWRQKLQNDSIGEKEKASQMNQEFLYYKKLAKASLKFSHS